jgi:hypothetical protein
MLVHKSTHTLQAYAISTFPYTTHTIYRNTQQRHTLYRHTPSLHTNTYKHTHSTHIYTSDTQTYHTDNVCAHAHTTQIHTTRAHTMQTDTDTLKHTPVSFMDLPWEISNAPKVRKSSSSCPWLQPLLSDTEHLLMTQRCHVHKRAVIYFSCLCLSFHVPRHTVMLSIPTQVTAAILQTLTQKTKKTR